MTWMDELNINIIFDTFGGIRVRVTCLCKGAVVFYLITGEVQQSTEWPNLRDPNASE